MNKIILAFINNIVAEKIKKMLENSGYSVYTICHSVDEILRYNQEIDISLIIMGYKLTDGTVLDVHEELQDSVKLMSLLKPEQIENLDDDDIYILPLPTNKVMLCDAIERLIGDYGKRKKPHKRDGTEKEIIENAKMILMKKNMMTEQQAHRFIQKRSMDTGSKMVDTAKFIVNCGL
ncbi:MAG: ANTAR domain-containing protein [Clostridia bacterium]|nr:ANTAR domain-containing protein [Clostridia bacterium]